MSDTDDDRDLCSNCSSSLHARCCAYCGSQKFPKKRLVDGVRFCSARCETTQLKQDKLSDALERGYMAMRLNKAVRAGLSAVRSLAQVTAENGVDMTGQECAEMRLAIQWLDQKMAKEAK